MRHSLSRTLLSAFSLATAGCASFVALPGNEAPTRELALSRTRVHSRPDVYTVRLQPSDTTAVASKRDSGSTKAAGSLRIVVFPDESFEYQLTVYNDARAQFTSAYLYRAPARPGNVKAILFNGETLTGRYIQLRGTGLFPMGVDRHALVSELRENPGAFVFRVESRGMPLAGSVQASAR